VKTECVEAVRLSAIIPTYNPDARRLRRTLQGLQGQSLPAALWETLLINNASTRFPQDAFFVRHGPVNLRVVAESQLGLTAARRRGFTEARGEICVLVDDDNVLAPDYLAEAVRLFAAHPYVGAMGGKSVPEFAVEPPPWTREFYGLLALRDLGDEPLVSHGFNPAGTGSDRYPPFAPIGAGLALRRAAVASWLADIAVNPLPDRRGSALTSGGDNDIILTLLHHGWEVGYFPALSLTHLIPARRCERRYLARLNRGIAQSWIQVLAKHESNPWGPISRWTVPLRRIKAWFAYRAWAGPVEFIRWQGACGHFDGQAALAAAASSPARRVSP
jgi:glycosyltransferase involved in cell wall biosynthesis